LEGPTDFCRYLPFPLPYNYTLIPGVRRHAIEEVYKFFNQVYGNRGWLTDRQIRT